MNTVKHLTRNPAETVKIGAELARHLKPGDIVCLFGDLGTGKTTLVKGLARGLKIAPDKVNSPTFVLLNIHEGKLPLYHFDLYRLETADEIATLGYEEYLYGEGVAVIEWADRLGTLTPKDHLAIRLSHSGDEQRTFEITAVGPGSQHVLEKIKL